MSARRQGAADPSIYLEVRDKDGTSMRVPLTSTKVIIGRSAESSLQLNSTTVSRQHAELYRDPMGRWWVRDLGSRNGTVVNGQRVFRDAELVEGDQLLVGRFEMIFRNAGVDGFHNDVHAAIGQDYVEDINSLTMVDSAPPPISEPLPEKPRPAAKPPQKAPPQAVPPQRVARAPIVEETPAPQAPTPKRPKPSDTLSRNKAYIDELTATISIVPIGDNDLNSHSGVGPSTVSSPQPAGKIDTIHLSTLTEFSQRLSKTEDTRERLRLLCRLMVRNDFHGKSAVAVRLSRTNVKQAPEVMCPPQLALGAGAKPPHVSRKLLQSVVKSEAPVLSSASAGPGQDAPGLAAVACPLHVDAENMDVIHVTFPEEYGTVEWMALVSLAAQQFMQTEAALANRKQAEARAAIEQELASAQKIQMRLVPRKPETRNLDVVIGFKPCKWVGGDYADVIELPDGRVFLVVADVCGKGLPAALVTSSLHTMVHVSLRAGLDLATLLTHLNEHLCTTMEDSSFVTLFAMIVDPATGNVECVNAGHPPPIVINPAGEVRHMAHSVNLPLGIAPDRPMEVSADRLEPGHLVTLYTDGLTEAADEDGQMFGIDQLGQYLLASYSDTEAAKRPLNKLSESLTQTLQSMDAGRDPTDDRTFIMARLPVRVPAPAPEPETDSEENPLGEDPVDDKEDSGIPLAAT